MAPTSTTKKSTTSKSKASSSSSSSATKTKRTVVKSASSASTVKKKIIKVKVQRKPKTTTTNNNKKKQPPKSKSKTKSNINPAIILSKNLPVTSKPPILPTNASALRPGSLLQQICNGRDIQLSRSAVVTPNIEKEKGKYLLIFPGMFSFNNNNNTTTTTTKKAAAATKEEEEEREVESDDGDLKSKSVNNDDDNDEDEDEDDDDDDDSPPKETTTKNRKMSATIATTPTQIHSLGRIEGLRTDIPTFKIPFPNIQKDLIFPGKKVQTTSKYLIMSCSNKKNGTVQCKVRSIILYIYYTVLYCTVLYNITVRIFVE